MVLDTRPAVACELRSHGYTVSPSLVFYGHGVHLSRDDDDFTIKLDSLPITIRLLILIYLALDS